MAINNFYTGLPNYATLKLVFEWIEPNRGVLIAFKEIYIYGFDQIMA